MRDSHRDFTNGQGLQYTGAALGLIAGLFVAIGTTGAVRAMSSALSLVSIGYGIGIGVSGERGTRLQQDLEKELRNEKQELVEEHDKKVIALKDQIKEFEAQHDEVIATIETAKNKNAELKAALQRTTTEKNEIQTHREALQAALIQLREQFQEAVSRRVEQLIAENEQQKSLAIAQARAKFEEDLKISVATLQGEYTEKTKRNKKRHIEREQQLLSVEAQYQEQFQKMKEHYQQLWDEAVEKYEDLIADYEGIIEQYEPQLKEIGAIFSTQYNAIVEERERIYAQLKSYHAAKTFSGSTKADINGNKLIDFFMREKIICDADHCISHFEYDEIWIRPRVGSVEELKKYAQQIHLEFELLRSPEFHIEHGCVKVTLRTHSKEKSATTTDVEERENWLEAVARVSNHYRIVAPTDAGKTVLLDNLNNCLLLIHGKHFCSDLFDPKYPFSIWRNLTPTFKGFDECIKGFRKLAQAIDDRITEATECVENDQPIPDYPAHLFALDETETTVDECRLRDNAARGKGALLKEITLLLRRGLKMGRGLTVKKGKGIIVAYVTQSPLSIRIGLNKDDFDNSTNIFLYEAIPRALEEELDGKLTNNQIAYLRKQYELRKERGDVYFCLVKTPREAFIVSLPDEGYYAAKVAAKNSIESVFELPEGIELSDPLPTEVEPTSLKNCPHCGSNEFNKNGQKRGVQYYRCKSCKKQFS